MIHDLLSGYIDTGGGLALFIYVFLGIAIYALGGIILEKKEDTQDGKDHRD